MSVLKNRLRATSIRLAFSALIACALAGVIFLVWYPYPYREISGGRQLFFIVVAVDVILGPLITLLIFDLRKGWPVLRKDLAMVVAVQLLALCYGIWTVHAARPVHLVFEYDRFRVIHAADIDPGVADSIARDFPQSARSGPTLVALRELTEQDRAKYTVQNVTGVLELSQQPELWVSYDSARRRVLKAAEPVESLKRRKPEHATTIDTEIQATGLNVAGLVALPLAGRDEFWTVILDGRTAEPVIYLKVDPF